MFDPNDRVYGARKVWRQLQRDGFDVERRSVEGALAETINGLYWVEVIHRRGPWRSFEAVEHATLEWVDWSNHRRPPWPHGNP